MGYYTMNLKSDWIRRVGINSKIKSYLLSLSVFLKFCLIAITIFLFGGNENANPTLGDSKIEFYSSDFRQLMNTEILKSDQNPDINSTGKLANLFYKQRQYMPAWTFNFKPNHAYDDLLSLLENAGSYGLLVSDYSFNELKKIETQMLNTSSEVEKLNTRLKLEELATKSAIEFSINLSIGHNNEPEDSLFIQLSAKLPEYLNLAIGSDELREGILDLQPQSEQYKLLQAALVKYLQLVKINSVEYSVENLKVTNGLVEKLLVEQGHLDKAFINDTAAISTAIKNYQKQNSLSSTGLPDEKTLASLGRSTLEIFNHIALNLDRLRKDELLKKNFILVNIPEFTLCYVDKEGVKNYFNVVVGKNNSPTPILSSQVQHIVANPHWTVPNSIAINEILPKIQSDSNYLTKHGYKVVDKDAKAIDQSSMDWGNMNQSNFKYYIRQDNGEKNALGIIKFLFPNEYSVYLHDTPSKQYFKKVIRTYSHGCVRVENPEKLAQLIIAENCTDGKDVSMEKLIRSKRQSAIKIDEPVPIFIKYYTTTADSNGNIYFHPDVYTYDQQAIEQLFAKADRN